MALKFSDLKQEYANLWSSMVIRNEKKGEVAGAVATIKSKKALYQKVSDVTGVPWFFIGIVHNLESNSNDKTHLHNGDPLGGRTIHVPSGRPVSGNPPFAWDVSAVDALKLKGLDAIKDWPLERMAYEFERYNGMGYRLAPGRGNSPYLWSFTNQYTRGKFKSDGNFDPTLVSQQCGAMALLKELITSGEKVDAPQPAASVSSNVVPLETGLFLAIGPFRLLPTATTQPNTVPDTEIVEDDEPVKKLAEVGPVWDIEVQLKGGGTKHGFARGGIFKAQTTDPVVDVEGFAQACLDAARLNQSSAHHLIAWADLETGIRNVAAKRGGGAGPFLITPAAWEAVTTGGALSLAARFDALKQPFAAARIAAHATKILQGSQLPTSAELYLAHLLSAADAKTVLQNPTRSFQEAMEAAVSADKVAEIREVRPWLFDGGMNVKDALTKIARAMDFGYVRADSLLQRIEPDLEIESAPPGGQVFAARLLHEANEEWEFFGKQERNAAGAQIRAGHKEDEAASAGSGEDYFARVGDYWREGTGRLGVDGRNRDQPWSAAFICYAVKSANPSGRFTYSARHSVYISKAIRDRSDQIQDAGYWCERLDKHQPKIGDIICWAREAGVDYDHQKGGDYDGHCDIVVAVRPGAVDVIGGNVGQSVTKRTFACDANGFLVGGKIQDETLFAIMANRIP